MFFVQLFNTVPETKLRYHAKELYRVSPVPPTRFLAQRTELAYTTYPRPPTALPAAGDSALEPRRYTNGGVASWTQEL